LEESLHSEGHEGAVYDSFVRLVQDWYGSRGLIPLHEPRFVANEEQYVADAIKSTLVSSVGEYVDRFEARIAEYTGARYAVATVNGTAALHIALKLVGVTAQSEVITQPLTFVATCNAIRYCGADPVFVDIDRRTLGMSSDSLRGFLDDCGQLTDEGCINRHTGRRIAACVPVHTFGHPVRIDAITDICQRYGVPVVEDAAESLGSVYTGRHTGTFGQIGILSFNGNKTITTGGGGMIITDDEATALHAKHVTTTAKLPHPWRYDHDEIGFNYRLPNLNAALGCAQMETLDNLLASKRELSNVYATWCAHHGIEFILEPNNARSNYWLHGFLMQDEQERNRFLEHTNRAKVMTRPAWTPMHQLPMFEDCMRVDLNTTNDVASRLVNVPSSSRIQS
jgi:aminotransferase in exopolysaccharide biosynthesis